jgi:UDP-N-acetylglucosamine/UDP-N-acetylgalactosamine 4-epimerase
MNPYQKILKQITQSPKKWLITGVSGFIGSNLLEHLLINNQHVVGLDNFSTGHELNLDYVMARVSEVQWKNFKLINGDIRDLSVCRNACSGVDYILHQAALGSVPKSFKEPKLFHEVNVDGFINILLAAKESNITKIVFASSSSVYGDSKSMPKIEGDIGKPLSPYAATKYINEVYADIFYRCYNLPIIGLRYFNVFGQRQDPKGSYSAVIPKWIFALLNEEKVIINGDGSISRDFCYVENVVQANILAATCRHDADAKRMNIFNIAVGSSTTLKELFELLLSGAEKFGIKYIDTPMYGPERNGDILHSTADICKAKHYLGYTPSENIEGDLIKTISWYLSRVKNEF